MTKDEQIAEAQRVADLLRDEKPAQAKLIDQAVADLQDGRRTSLTVKASYKLTLHKFDGDYEPGKQSVEIVVREGVL